MKFVILDGFLANHDEIGLCIDGHEQVWYPSTDPEQVVERIGNAEGVLVNRTGITEAAMDACPGLRFIGTFSTGYNMVDVQAAQARGITVCNVPGYSTGAVAQHTFALLLEIACRIGLFERLVHEGGWNKDDGQHIAKIPTMELAGKTMGIFGAGEIGTAVAHLATAFGMKVLAYRRSPQPDSLHYVDVDTLLSQSDVLSIHAPLNEQTSGYFSAGVIEKMKDGAILLNTARGALLDEAAVAAALTSGKLYAAGLDVLAVEPPEKGNPLACHPRAVVTPHVAWRSRETRERLLRIVAENILAFAAGTPQNTVCE